jgi:PleD family two-component response regulator
MSTRQKLLLVEDSATTLQLEEVILKQTYDVLTARTGTEGLQVAINQKPDLILLDVMLPKLDGFEVCRLLRSIEVTKHIPIIMVSTLGDAQSQQTAFALGCNDYIAKPIDRSELLSKIERCLAPPPEQA